MLEMRPGCECCDRDLPADQTGAWICSYECTFCEPCALEVLRSVCPNCGGMLVQRPPRSAEKLIQDPASTRRVFKPEGCAAAPSRETGSGSVDALAEKVQDDGDDIELARMVAHHSLQTSPEVAT